MRALAFALLSAHRMTRETPVVLGVLSLIVLAQLGRCDSTSSFSFHPNADSGGEAPAKAAHSKSGTAPSPR
ncbi:hypothetical protein [Labilithrix luteola]|uniref:hypothetical protein n=1 Tax=Labilithrix luteola TaxID=1391654 RepID=UPI0011BA4C39|nr:hypothetical protein [Labilithrix luteola]